MMLSGMILVSLKLRKVPIFQIFGTKQGDPNCLNLLHSERPKLHTILAFLSTKGLKDEEGVCHVQLFLMHFYFSDI